MKFNLKTVGIVLGGLAGILVLAAVLFVVFFPKQLAAQEAEKRIEAATHRQLTLGNDISVSFYPALGFTVNDVSLSNPEGFDSAQPFIKAKRLTFAVALLPLLSGQVQVRQLIFEGAELNLRAKRDGAANWTFPTEENSNQQNTLEDLRLDDVRLVDGAVSFDGGDGKAPMQLSDVDAGVTLESLDQPAKLTAALTYLRQRVTIDGTLGKPRAVLEKGETPMQAHVQAAPLDATFDGAFNAATGALNGNLNASGNSLRALLAWIGSPMQQGAGFGAFRVAGTMQHADQTTALNNIDLSLDAIRAHGNLTIITPPNPNGRLQVNGALTAPSIDLNTYLPAPAQGAQAGGVTTSTAWSNDALDLSGLRALNANLSLGVGTLKFQRFTFSDVAMALKVANGAVDGHLTRVSMYGGSGTARLIANGAGATPQIAVELNVQNVQAEPLLKDAIAFDRISGRGHLQVALAGAGRSQAALMHALHGTAAFTFNDGAFKGVNLAAIARSIQSALSGTAVGPGASTDFAELGASFTVANGSAATQDLHMLNPFVRVDGQGVINIGEQSIDMRLAPRAVRSNQGQGGDAATHGLGIPFRVHGPWSHVGFEPALGDVVQNQLRSQIGNILGHQDQNNPLTQLGASLFGNQGGASDSTTPPATSGQSGASTPAPAQQSGSTASTATPQQEQPRQPSLGDLLRQATQGRHHNNSSSNDTTTSTTAPSP
ncbi:MAG: AsmA family protein [Terricaulis sp.]